MERSASALWTLGLTNGKGSLCTRSGALRNTQYNFRTCFEDRPGTNPEELIAAAHAGCFTMALAARLEAADMTPESIHTRAAVTLETVAGEYSITCVHLDVVACIPGADRQCFERLATLAGTGCLVSRLLNTRIVLSARLGNPALPLSEPAHIAPMSAAATPRCR